jgi:hypothetical protein
MISILQDCIGLKDNEEVEIKMIGYSAKQSPNSKRSTGTAIANTTPGVNNNAYFCTY